MELNLKRNNYRGLPEEVMHFASDSFGTEGLVLLTYLGT